MFKLLTVATFFIASFANADCSTVRLDQGGSMTNVNFEAHVQGQMGDCFAHAAAQMYDAWRFLNHDPMVNQQSSGFEINQRYKLRRFFLPRLSQDLSGFQSRQTDIEAGFLKRVIPLLVRDGSCDQNELNRMFKGISVDQYSSEVLKIYYEQKVALNQEVNFELIQRFPDSVAWTQIKKATTREYIESSYEIEDALKPLYLLKGILELQKYHEKFLNLVFDPKNLENLGSDLDSVSVFEAIGIIKCSQQDRIKVSKQFKIDSESHYGWIRDGRLFTWQKEYQPRSTLAVVNQELDRPLEQAMPIGIAYCSRVLKEGRKYGSRVPSDPACENHSSLIIGRQMSAKGRCQFLIRNTWGAANNYHPDWTSIPDHGSVWVDADVLANSIYETETAKR